jgi:hypothetical protein
MPDYESADRVIEATRRTDGQIVNEIVGFLRETRLEATPVSS